MKQFARRMLSKINIHQLSLAVLLIGAAILRLYGFDDWSLTNDELSALERLNFSTWRELIANGIATDGHPAFTQVFLYFYTKFFGFSTFAIRLPFVLAGILSCIYIYKFIKIFINQNAALISLAIFASSYFYILYAQIARPYALGIFFTLAFHYYWYKLIIVDQKKSTIICFVLFSFLGIISHYFASLTIILTMFIGLFYLNKQNFRFYITASVISALLCCVHLPITLKHLSIGGLSWLPIPDEEFLHSLLETSYNGLNYWYILFFCLPMLALLSKKHQFLNGNAYLLALLFFIPLEIGVFYSKEYSPVLQFSVMLFSLPFLLSFSTAFFSKNSNPKWIAFLSLFLFTFLSFQLIENQSFYQQKKFADFKSVSEKIIAWSKKYGEDNTLILTNSNNKQYFNYYLRDHAKLLNQGIHQFPDNQSIAAAREMIDRSDFDAIILAYANVPLPSVVFEYARDQFPVKQEELKSFNARASLFTKGKIAKQNKDYVHLFSPIDSAGLSMNYQFKGNDEYALTYAAPMKELMNKEQAHLIFSADFLAQEKEDIHWVFTVNRADSTIYWKGENLKELIKINEWARIKSVADWQENFKEGDLVKVYFWNPNKINFQVKNAGIFNYANRDYNPYE